MSELDTILGPHQGQPVLSAGAPLDQARAAVVMAHGRGSTAQYILELAAELDVPGCAYLAPQAMGKSWYPHSFLAPLSSNEPCLTSALAAVGDVVAQIERQGVASERILLFGFSQGASLVLEFAARHARRYGGVAGLSGGLIGPDGTPRDYPGDFAGTPIFLGCSDTDPYIPQARVLLSAEVLRRMGADVDVHLYPEVGHTVNADEMQAVRGILERLLRGRTGD